MGCLGTSASGQDAAPSVLSCNSALDTASALTLDTSLFVFLDGFTGVPKPVPQGSSFPSDYEAKTYPFLWC